MKLKKGILKGLFWVLVLALLLAPSFLIWRLSREEMKQYEAKSVPAFRETAYGSIAKARRADVEVAVTVSGRCVCEEFVYMELTQKSPQNIRWYVREGDEVLQGQPVGILGDTEIVCSCTGILREINTYAQAPYLRIQLLEPVEVECLVDAKTLRTLQRAEDGMKTEEGEAAALTYASLSRNAEGLTTVRLRIDSPYYVVGMEVKELTLLTGQRYLHTLVLDPRCLYQKEEGSEQWYARRVSEDGIFIEEVRVNVGYSDGQVVCVTGVNEGDCFDTGYQAIAAKGNGT